MVSCQVKMRTNSNLPCLKLLGDCVSLGYNILYINNIPIDYIPNINIIAIETG